MILQEDSYSDYGDYLEKVRDLLMEINTLEDQKEKTDQSQKIIEDSIITANEISEAGEFFEAGEFLISIAELLEGFISFHSAKLYKLSIKYWNNELNSFKLQGKLHEVAELFLRIADLYEKLDESKSYKKNILGSIDYLKRESKLRKYCWTLQNKSDGL